MTISEQDILSLLSQTIDPTIGKDYVTTKTIHNIRIEQNNVWLDVELGYPAQRIKNDIEQQIINTLKTLPGIGNIHVSVRSKIIPHSVQQGVKLIPGIKILLSWLRARGLGNPQRLSI